MEDADVVLVGYGEIGTKSSTVRGKMAARLASNLRALLADRGFDATVEAEWPRLYVRTARPGAAADAVAEAPGVVLARPARECEPTLPSIREALCHAARDHGDGSFAVRARRHGDGHGFTSGDIEREGGAALVEATDAPVDLDDPDVTYWVEVRGDRAVVSSRTADGPGGLPLGTHDRAVALISGGIDSPVAAWEMMRRGCAVTPVYVDLGDYGGADHRARAVETVRRLASRAPDHDMDLRVISMGEVVADLVDAVADTRMLSLRRAMLCAAAVVADEVGAHSLVTGESLGQKSSQTGRNIAATDAAVDYPIHRPLVTRDKKDVVALARELGTFEDATLPVGCERIAPPHPETNGSIEAVRAAEPDDLLDRAAAAAVDRYSIDVDSGASSRP